METSSKAFVYLQRNPRPIRKPVAGQCQEKFGLRSIASQKVNMAAVQKKTESGSIVIRMLPTLNIGIALIASTAQNPVAALKSLFAK